MSNDADRAARAVAAADEVEVVHPDGTTKTYKVRPLVVQHLCDLERTALAAYRKEYLSGIKQAIEAGLVEKSDALQYAVDAAKWTVDDLPQKIAYDPMDIKLTDKLKRWVEQFHPGVLSDGDPSDGLYLAVTVTAMDGGQLSEKKITELTDHAPRKNSIRYDQWWITASVEGMRQFVLTSVQYEHPDVTSDEVSGWPLAYLQTAARTVENITATAAGNI